MLETTSSKTSPDSLQNDFERALESFYGNWIWRAVYALVDHQDFDWSPEWISEKLGISNVEAMDAVVGLTDLGLIRKTETGFEQGQLQIIIPEGMIDTSKQINQHQLLSEEMLNLMSPDRAGAFYNYFAPGTKESVHRLYTKVKEAFDDFLKENQTAKNKKSGVFAFSFTAVDVTKDGQGRKS
jgi:predicted transcriptional regulator